MSKQFYFMQFIWFLADVYMSKQFFFQAIQLNITCLNVKTVLFQTIQLIISVQFKFRKSSISNNLVDYKCLSVKTVLFQVIQLSINLWLNVRTVLF